MLEVKNFSFSDKYGTGILELKVDDKVHTILFSTSDDITEIASKTLIKDGEVLVSDEDKGDFVTIISNCCQKIRNLPDVVTYH